MRHSEHNQRVVVTGADGRLGRAVVLGLAERGYDVLATDRRPLEACHANVRTVSLDLASADSDGALRDAFAKCHGVVHLAAQPSPAGPGFGENFPTDGMQANVAAMWRVFTLAAHAKVPRLIFSSSVHAGPNLNEIEQRVPLSVDHPGPPRGLYGATKILAESFGGRLARMHDLAFIALRIGRLVDTETFEEPGALERFREHGDAASAFTSMHDAVRAVDLALTSPTPAAGESLICYLTSRTYPPDVFDLQPARRVLGFVPDHDFATFIAQADNDS